MVTSIPLAPPQSVDKGCHMAKKKNIVMDRKRVAEEIIAIMCRKLLRLPRPTEEPHFDYEGQIISPNVTRNHLDIAEVVMEIEDNFGIVFDGPEPGDDSETIGHVINFVHEEIALRYPNCVA